MAMDELPVAMLGALVQALHMVELEDLEPFSLEDCEPVEFVGAFVSIESGLVFGLGFWFGPSPTLHEATKVFWRESGEQHRRPRRHRRPRDSRYGRARLADGDGGSDAQVALEQGW